MGDGGKKWRKRKDALDTNALPRALGEINQIPLQPLALAHAHPALRVVGERVREHRRVMVKQHRGHGNWSLFPIVKLPQPLQSEKKKKMGDDSLQVVWYIPHSGSFDPARFSATA